MVYLISEVLYFLLNSRVRVGGGGGESLKFEVQLGYPVGVRRVDHFSFLFWSVICDVMRFQNIKLQTV